MCVLPAQPGLYVTSYDGRAYDVAEFSSLDQFSRIGRIFNFWFSKPLDTSKRRCRAHGDEFRPADPSRPYLCYCRFSWRFASLASAIVVPSIDVWYDDEDLYPTETALEAVPGCGTMPEDLQRGK